MKYFVWTAAIAYAGIFSFATNSNAQNIKEGQWSMTTVIQMGKTTEGQTNEAMQEMENMSPEEKAMMQQMMGGMKIGPAGGGMGMSTTMTQCMTNDNPVPKASDKEDCTQTHSIKGNTVNFEVVCPDSHSTGQVTYKKDSMKGTIKSTQAESGEEVTIDISGQYVGPCDQNAANNLAGPGLSDKELAIKQKELDLKMKELELKQKELDLQATVNPGNNKSGDKSAIENVNTAVNTTNNVKNTLGGLRSLLGR